MLIEPGPLALLDLAWFERALAILPPLDVADAQTRVLLDAADRIDAIVVNAGAVDPPDQAEDEFLGALGPQSADADTVATSFSGPAPGEFPHSDAQVEAELTDMESTVFGSSLIAPVSPAPEQPALDAIVAGLPDVDAFGKLVDDGGGGDQGGDDGGGGPLLE